MSDWRLWFWIGYGLLLVVLAFSYYRKGQRRRVEVEELRAFKERWSEDWRRAQQEAGDERSTTKE